MKVVSPLFLSLMLVAQAHAFDVWGFRSGMKQDQVDAIARQQEYHSKRASPQTKGLVNVWYTRKTAGGPYDVGYIASFCDGRLIWLSRDYKGSTGTLFEVLHDLQATYGAPTVESVKLEGQARSLNFNFPVRDQQDSVSISMSFDESSDTDFSLQVIHKTLESCP